MILGKKYTQSFFSLFNHFFLRVQHFSGFDEIRIGRSHLQLNAARFVVQVHPCLFVIGHGLFNPSLGSQPIEKIPAQLNSSNPAMDFVSQVCA